MSFVMKDNHHDQQVEYHILVINFEINCLGQLLEYKYEQVVKLLNV